MKCNHCGAEAPEDAIYCGKCGTLLDREDTFIAFESTIEIPEDPEDFSDALNLGTVNGEGADGFGSEGATEVLPPVAAGTALSGYGSDAIGAHDAGASSGKIDVGGIVDGGASSDGLDDARADNDGTDDGDVAGDEADDGAGSDEIGGGVHEGGADGAATDGGDAAGVRADEDDAAGAGIDGGVDAGEVDDGGVDADVVGDDVLAADGVNDGGVDVSDAGSGGVAADGIVANGMDDGADGVGTENGSLGFDAAEYVGVGSAHAREMPSLYYSEPGVTVNPPTPPYMPQLGKSVLIGLGVIGVAVAVIMIAVIGWVVLPSLFASVA